MTGLALGLAGLGVLVALATYDPADPSMNTATVRHAANLAGPVGATMADLALQGFGLAGALPGLAMLAWCWRIASRGGMDSVVARIVALAAAVPVFAAVLAALPLPGPPAWPTMAGLGGAVGRLLADRLLKAGAGLMGPFGAATVWTVCLGLAVTLSLLSLGLAGGDWLEAWRLTARGCRASSSAWHRASGAAARAARSAFGGLAARFPGKRDAMGGGDGSGDVPAGMPRDMPQPDIRSGGWGPPATISPPDPNPGDPPSTQARIIRPAGQTARKPQQLGLQLAQGAWQFPPLSLLTPPPPRAAPGPTSDALQANARQLESVLADYGVKGAIGEIRPGPVVTFTSWSRRPAPGVPASSGWRTTWPAACPSPPSASPRSPAAT